MWYGFGSQAWMMWAAGILAAISSITYPAISSYVSTHTDIDKQGVVQGIVTGMRGLCAGLGPAVFGFIFYLFHVDLNQGAEQNNTSLPVKFILQGPHHHVSALSHQVPGPPFVFGAMLVLLALTVSAFIPEERPSAKNRKQSGKFGFL
ncbi:UNVERIFIED_CONTAM: hypothetical protein GTU68_046603 [Idotea baltica]|nr:hypothetical protein [Idotea baltica]